MSNKIKLAYTRYLAPDGRLTGELPPWADDFNPVSYTHLTLPTSDLV